MRDLVPRAAFTAWLAGLAVALVVGLTNGPAWLLEAASVTWFGGALILVLACYGLRYVVTRLVPFVVALAAVGWLLRTVGLDVASGRLGPIAIGIAVAVVMRRIGPFRDAKPSS